MAFVPASATSGPVTTVRFLEGNEIIAEQPVIGSAID
jgi:hypothetical protein